MKEKFGPKVAKDLEKIKNNQQNDLELFDNVAQDEPHDNQNMGDNENQQLIMEEDLEKNIPEIKVTKKKEIEIERKK